MDVAVIPGPREAGLTKKPVPRASGRYVVIKVLVAPMCNEYVAYTDGIYLERNRPDSLGHEMAGVVVDAPSGASVSVGQRVVALCGFPCGVCRPCLRGYYAHCVDTRDPLRDSGNLSGECSFAQYAIKADWMCVPVPEDMALEDASLACCGLGPTFGALDRMAPQPGSTLLITGLGPVGLGGVVNGVARGCSVTGVARSAYRARMALDLGCERVVGPAQARASLDEPGWRGFDFALDCSGQPEYQRLMIDSLAHLGTAAFIAEPGGLDLNVEHDLVLKGTSLLGSLDINRAQADLLLQVIRNGSKAIEHYVTHRLPLADVGKAFELQADRACGKVLLFPWPEEYSGG